ncbi:MAG: ExeM/NucH family extracellular endonuclease, partial [Vicinamibacterales bacterium]
MPSSLTASSQIQLLVDNGDTVWYAPENNTISKDLSPTAFQKFRSEWVTLGTTPVIINEIDYDQVGTDSAEYLELKNISGSAVNLDNYTVQLINGSGTTVYDTIELPNVTLGAGDYYVICADAADVPNCDLDDGPDTDFIQNGSPDAVGLRLSGVLVDAVSYEGNTGAPYTEGTGTPAATASDSNSVAFIGLSRFPDGADTNDNSADVSIRCITPGAANSSATSGCSAPVTPITLNISDVTANETDSGTTSFTFNVTLTSAAGVGGVTFDIATADGTAEDDTPATEDNDYVQQALTGQSIPAGTTGPYPFTVTVNGDTVSESNETFFVNVSNIVGATAGDTQGQGTITNDDVALTFIHDVQGPGAATPVPGSTVKVEGIVVGTYQGSSQLSGFFLQEEDADVDANLATSEGIFVFCNTCPTAVSEGQRVQVLGTVSEFFNLTEITASTAGSVVVTDAGNNIAQVTPSTIDLPVTGDVNAFYEAREGMRVTFSDTLTVSEYFELFRYGQIELYEGGRPKQFTEDNAPNVAGNTAHLDDLNRRRVVLDDENNIQNWPLTLPNGRQFVFHPRANGGFSVGTQGVDFFRGGDVVRNLTGVLHWSFAGFTGTDAWRIRPTATTPVAFTVANPRPATPPAVGGAIKAASMNLLNYFTTIDTTSSNSTGPCSPSGTLDCRGADSVAELNRQRERASIVVCSLNADVFGFMELENTTPSDTITDLLGAINTRCGGVHPYAFVNTGGTLGTDAIRVALIYRTGVLSPVGAALVDLDAVHNRPPTAQTFDVVDATNPAFGQRFTVIANHFKSKGCPGTGGDADAGDGQGCFNATRVAQANRLLTWVNSTVVPTAGDPDVLLLGDFNSYAKENPITTIEAGGFTDMERALLGGAAYSYLFDGQLGHLDYAFASTSLVPFVSGIGAWHINADEVPLFDYNDEVFDSPGEAAFEEKPDGSALAIPRVVFQPASPYRAADHDPILIGLFPATDLRLTKNDFVPAVLAGQSVTYTIEVTNDGPTAVTGATVTDAFPAQCASVQWTCSASGSNACATTGPVAGNINTTVTLAVGGMATFQATCSVSPSAAGLLVNKAVVAPPAGIAESDLGDNEATDTDTIQVAQMSLTKMSTTPTYSQVGDILSYSLVVKNTGNMPLTNVVITDPLLPTLSCLPSQPAALAPNATLTCTGSYVITGADLTRGFVTNTATATGLADDSFIPVNNLIVRPEAIVIVTAQGNVTVFGAAPGVSSTRLTLASCSLDLKQDWQPIYTKLKFDVWNEDEVKFTGAFECADSWHETDFGTNFDAGAQDFSLAALGTYAARYRAQAIAS